MPIPCQIGQYIQISWSPFVHLETSCASSFDPIRTNTPIDNTAIVPPDDDDDDELSQSDCEVDGNNMKSVSRRMVNVNGFEKLGTTFIFTAQHFSKIYIGCGIFWV